MSVIYLGHTELAEALRLCYRAEMLAVKAGAFVRLPAVIWGDPGSGKTSAAREMTKALAQEFEDAGIKSGFWSTALALKNAEDIGGYPVPNKEDGVMMFLPPSEMPFLHNGNRKDPPYGIWVIDDVDRSAVETRNAAMSILLDRKINGNEISPKVYVCATANGESDVGTTSPLGGAFGNRLVHLYLRPQSGWTEHLKYPALCGVEDILPIHHTEFEEKAMCTPRSIEMALWVIKSVKDESPLVVRAVVNGCVGSEGGAILSKLAFRKVSLDDILNGTADIDISLDDIELLSRELKRVPVQSQVAVKQAVEKWAVNIQPEFQRTIKATLSYFNC